MALDTASERNFNTRNPEEALRLIENLTAGNSTKNTDFERRKSATLGKDELDDAKAKMDSVHQFLKKQVRFAEDIEAVEINSDGDREEDVNFISGTCFQNQRYGNQSGYINSYGNGQKSGENQSPQHQQPFSSNNNSNNRAYGNSFYKNPPPQNRESKIESMLDQVPESQQKLMVISMER